MTRSFEHKNFENDCYAWSELIDEAVQKVENDEECLDAKALGFTKVIYEAVRENFPFRVTYSFRNDPDGKVSIDYRIVLIRNVMDILVRRDFVLALRRKVIEYGDVPGVIFLSYRGKDAIACDLRYKESFSLSEEGRCAADEFVKKISEFDHFLIQEFEKDTSI